MRCTHTCRRRSTPDASRSRARRTRHIRRGSHRTDAGIPDSSSTRISRLHSFTTASRTRCFSSASRCSRSPQARISFAESGAGISPRSRCSARSRAFKSRLSRSVSRLQRAHHIFAILTFVSLSCFASFVETRRTRHLVAAVVYYFLACSVHEIGYVLVPLYFIEAIGRGRPLRTSVAATLPFAAIGAAMLATAAGLRLRVHGRFGELAMHPDAVAYVFALTDQITAALPLTICCSIRRRSLRRSITPSTFRTGRWCS